MSTEMKTWRWLAVATALILPACGRPNSSSTPAADAAGANIFAAIPPGDASSAAGGHAAIYLSAPEGTAALAYCEVTDTRTCKDEAADFKPAVAAIRRGGRAFFTAPVEITLAQGKRFVVLTRDAAGKTLSTSNFEVRDPQAQNSGGTGTGTGTGAGTTTTSNDGDTYITTPTSFRLTAYILPSPDQLGAGDCLYMAGTGIMEFLLNKRLGVKAPRVGGDTDISEEMAVTLASKIQLPNDYTDIVDLFPRYGGYILDKDLPFQAYASSTWTAGTGVDLDKYKKLTNIPTFGRTTLFSSGAEGTQVKQNVLAEKDLEAIKNALRQYKSPVLFVFKPSNVDYWHANMIIGFDDTKRVFLARDSAFGEERTDLSPYTYGDQSPWGPKAYRDTWELSYDSALVWGNHATVYYLTN